MEPSYIPKYGERRQTDCRAAGNYLLLGIGRRIDKVRVQIRPNKDPIVRLGVLGGQLSTSESAVSSLREGEISEKHVIGGEVSRCG